jgi:hypothetical protein
LFLLLDRLLAFGLINISNFSSFSMQVSGSKIVFSAEPDDGRLAICIQDLHGIRLLSLPGSLLWTGAF